MIGIGRWVIGLLLLAASHPALGQRVTSDRLPDGGWRVSGPDWTVDMTNDGHLTLRRGEPPSASASVRFAFRPAADPAVLPMKWVAQNDGTNIVFSLGAPGDGPSRQLTVSANGILTVDAKMSGDTIHIAADWRHALLPGFYLEDARYDRPDISGDPARIPADQVLCVLTGDGEGMLVMGWDDPDADVWLDPGAGDSGMAGVIARSHRGRIQADLMVAPGLWHAADGEPDPPDEPSRIDLGWRRPFDATWCAEVEIDGSDLPTRTKWPFQDVRKERNWWIGVGNHPYPLTFDTDGNAFFEPSNTIRSDARGLLIYALQGHAGSLMGAVGRMDTLAVFHSMLEQTEAYPRPRDVPVAGFHWCWGTVFMREQVLRSGLQHRDAAYFREWADYMLDMIEATQLRRHAYADFLDGMAARWTRARKASNTESPAGALAAAMATTATQLQSDYRRFVQTDGFATPEDAVAAARTKIERFGELVAVPGTAYIPAFESIVSRINQLAFAQRETTGLFGWRLRRWHQQAAEACGEDAEAVRQARELRRELLGFLVQRGFVTRL